MVKAIAQSGAKGIVSINSLPMHVIDTNGKPAFGEGREQCGVSGEAIRTLALKQIKKIILINTQNNFELTIIGVGGIMQPEHMQDFLNAGATVALSATGLMTVPYLTQEMLQSITTVK